MSSWSSPECSPPCHGGGHGFKSHRGRSTARYANRQSDQAQTLVNFGKKGTGTICRNSPKGASHKWFPSPFSRDCGFDSHPCYWTTCVGWALASLSGCNPHA
jgi:hypothetical protein